MMPLTSNFWKCRVETGAGEEGTEGQVETGTGEEGEEGEKGKVAGSIQCSRDKTLQLIL